MIMTECDVKKMVVVALVFCAGLGARAELQEWTLIDGTTFEAELVTIYPTEIIFKNAQGVILKYPLERFSQEMKVKIELANPPTLSMELIKDRDSISFTTGVNLRMTRPPEVRCAYGMRIKQTSRGSYNHELFAEMFVLGRERQGKKYILLDRQTTSFFLPEDKREAFEFRSDHKVVLQNFYVNETVRGEKYFGYLIVVKDIRGEIIGVRATHDWLFENLENLNERYVNNFIDETCARVFPTRPPVFFRSY